MEIGVFWLFNLSLMLFVEVVSSICGLFFVVMVGENVEIVKMVVIVVSVDLSMEIF